MATDLAPYSMPHVETYGVLGKESAYVLGFHLTDYLWQEITAETRVSTYILITTTSLAGLYLADHKAAFQRCIDSGILAESGDIPRLLTYSVLSGEASKTRETKARIEDYMISEACTSDSCII